jgi:hypothetical protein
MQPAKSSIVPSRKLARAQLPPSPRSCRRTTWPCGPARHLISNPDWHQSAEPAGAALKEPGYLPRSRGPLVEGSGGLQVCPGPFGSWPGLAGRAAGVPKIPGTHALYPVSAAGSGRAQSAGNEEPSALVLATGVRVPRGSCGSEGY